MTRYALAIDLGGTKIAAGLVDAHGRLSHYQRLPTPQSGGEAIAAALVTVGEAVLEAAPHTPQSIGIGTAGVVDRQAGIVRYASENLPGWAGYPVGPHLEAHFKLPVIAENDVNAMAYGELAHGAAQDVEHALFMTVGTGIGGALILNHELWSGVHWTAGEIGYLPVDGHTPVAKRSNHLESHAGGPGIERAYQQLAGLEEPLPLQTLAAQAQQIPPDRLAQKVIADGATLLGNVLAGVIGFLDVEAVIIGGGVPNIGPLWWEPLTAAFRAGPLPSVREIELRPAGLKQHAGLIGAGALALSNTIHQPTQSAQ